MAEITSVLETGDKSLRRSIRYAPYSGARLPLPMVAAGGRAGYAHSSSRALSLSDGTQLSGMSVGRLVATCSASNLRVAFGNYAYNAFGPNAITVKAALVVGTEIVPLFFNGRRSVTIDKGGVALSDPSGMRVIKGNAIFVRTWVTVASLGEKWPFWNNLFSAIGEGYASPGTDVVDATTAVTHTGADGSGGYGPAAIIGYPDTAQKSVVILGDSIEAGIGGSTGLIHGWAEQFLGNEVGWCNVSRHGEPLSDVIGAGEIRQYKLPWLDGATHAIVGYPTNDIRGGQAASSVKANLLTLWNWLDARGIKIWQRTIPPQATSSNGWVDLAGQSLPSFEAARLDVNAYIRSKPAPLTGVLDIAAACETSPDSGFWKSPNNTADGIHPAQTAVNAIVASLSLPTFLA